MSRALGRVSSWPFTEMCLYLKRMLSSISEQSLYDIFGPLGIPSLVSSV